MSSTIEKARETVIAGERLDGETMLRLVAQGDHRELLSAADAIRHHFRGNRFHLCSIINAKSGNCTEDCRFCAQSSRYRTDIERYDIVDASQALAVARENDALGVKRLSLVTSGKTADDATLDRLAEIYGEMKEKTSLRYCASLGLLEHAGLERLTKMGVDRYHCNLEACRSFFPKVCSTHTWETKVNTLAMAVKAGMSVCSGGIIGMGESLEDRISLALELRELGIESIPINILNPIAKTPMAALQPLTLDEVLTAIACFRFINPQAVIRVAGGRGLLGDKQYRCFAAGANGAIVGNYLTTVGAEIDEDLAAISALGYVY